MSTHRTATGLVIVNTTTAAEYADAYRAARRKSRLEGATLAERETAWAQADRIAQLAERAGITLDVIELDDEARRDLYAVRVDA